MTLHLKAQHSKLDELKLKADNSLHSLQLMLSSICNAAQSDTSDVDAVQLHADLQALFSTLGTIGFDTQQFVYFTSFSPFQDNVEWWLSFTQALNYAYNDTGEVQYGMLYLKVGDEWVLPQPHILFEDADEDPTQKDAFLSRINNGHVPYRDSLSRMHAYHVYTKLQNDCSELTLSEKYAYFQCKDSFEQSIAWIMQNRPLLPFDKDTVKWVKYPSFCALLEDCKK